MPYLKCQSFDDITLSLTLKEGSKGLRKTSFNDHSLQVISIIIIESLEGRVELIIKLSRKNPDLLDLLQKCLASKLEIISKYFV